MPCVQKRKDFGKFSAPEVESSLSRDSVLKYFIDKLTNSTIAKNSKGRIEGHSIKAFDQNDCNSKIILNNAGQSIQMMEIASMNCSFYSDCCEITYQNILNEDSEESIHLNQNSPQWHKARQFRITGSRCYEIYTYGGMDWEMKSKKYFWPKSFTNKYIKHGLTYEGAAKEAFILKMGVNVDSCGMVMSSENKWLGFSPDGIVVENDQPVALLEIKCLYADSNLAIDEAVKTCSFILNSNGHYSLKKKQIYYGQVQMGMSMLNLNKCYLSLYSSYDDTCIVIEIYFD